MKIYIYEIQHNNFYSNLLPINQYIYLSIIEYNHQSYYNYRI